MHIWKFDENRCDFAPAKAESITADPGGTYLVADGDQLVLNEGGSLRSIPHDETLIAVAGQRFERERFDVHPLPDTYLQSRRLAARQIALLQDEMRRDGIAMQRWLRARSSIDRWIRDEMLPLAEGPWSFISGRWIGDGRYTEATLQFEPQTHWLPVLEMKVGHASHTGPVQIQGTLRGAWNGNRLVRHSCVREGVDGGEPSELGAWWAQFIPWLDLPRSCGSFLPLDVG
jgi:hypothetical protein